MLSFEARYGHNLSVHLNIEEHHDDAEEAKALYERLKEPAQMRRISDFKADLGIKHERMDIFIEEIAEVSLEGADSRPWGKCLSRSDHFMKGIYLQAGGWHDDTHPLRTLAHEMIHAAFSTHLSGWQAAVSTFDDDENHADAAVYLGAVNKALVERGEEKLALILTDLLWERLL